MAVDQYCLIYSNEYTSSSSVTLSRSLRALLLNGGLLVRVPPEEPISVTKSGPSDRDVLSFESLCPFLALFVFLPLSGLGEGGFGGSSRLTSAARNAGDKCAYRIVSFIDWWPSNSAQIEQ